jgi:hypothetical protein
MNAGRRCLQGMILIYRVEIVRLIVYANGLNSVILKNVVYKNTSTIGLPVFKRVI